jgi:hypothetical protein
VERAPHTAHDPAPSEEKLQCSSCAKGKQDEL